MLTVQQRSRLRKLIRTAPWKHATSPQYRTAPHSYIVRSQSCRPELWDWFASLIRDHGTYRTWKGHRYKYLVLEGDCFWVMWPILNRADASTLDPVPQAQGAETASGRAKKEFRESRKFSK